MTKTYKLEIPIAHGSEQITELTIRRPTVADMRKMDQEKGAIGQTVALLSSCSEQPPSVISKMDGVDFQRVGALLADFLDGGRPTGGS